MFSDTHFHLKHCADRGADTAAALARLAERDTFFALDIGTEPGDIDARLSIAARSLAALASSENAANGGSAAGGASMGGANGLAKKAGALLRFSLGIWPSKAAILARGAAVKELRDALARVQSDPALGGRVVALGECGLDHHWNPAGADKRSEDDFDAKILAGEAELFGMMLDLGRETGLPVIAHSRDAFDGTLSCIAHSGVSRGVMHCFSYGIPEARAVLNQGWHISFSGAITYAKKSLVDAMAALVRFVPRDRLLIETDAPYLAPAPHRGETNTPVWVKEVYRAAARHLEITPEELSLLVDENIRSLFALWKH
jgi:TatD DNase family protein